MDPQTRVCGPNLTHFNEAQTMGKGKPISKPLLVTAKHFYGSDAKNCLNTMGQHLPSASQEAEQHPA